MLPNALQSLQSILTTIFAALATFAPLYVGNTKKLTVCWVQIGLRDQGIATSRLNAVIANVSTFYDHIGYVIPRLHYSLQALVLDSAICIAFAI